MDEHTGRQRNEKANISNKRPDCKYYRRTNSLFVFPLLVYEVCCCVFYESLTSEAGNVIHHGTTTTALAVGNFTTLASLQFDDDDIHIIVPGPL